jgi:hypothetical protein
MLESSNVDDRAVHELYLHPVGTSLSVMTFSYVGLDNSSSKVYKQMLHLRCAATTSVSERSSLSLPMLIP